MGEYKLIIDDKFNPLIMDGEFNPSIIDVDKLYDELNKEYIIKPELERKQRQWEYDNLPRKVLKYKKRWDKQVLDWIKNHPETSLRVIKNEIRDGYAPRFKVFKSPKQFIQNSPWGEEIYKEYGWPIEYEYDDKYNRGRKIK